MAATAETVKSKTKAISDMQWSWCEQCKEKVQGWRPWTVTFDAPATTATNATVQTTDTTVAASVTTANVGKVKK